MFARILGVMLAAALIISLYGCSAGDNKNSSEDTITVTDQAGRNIEIPQPVQRLVSGYYISSSVCIALGLAGRLAGIEARADTRPIYALAAPELLALPNVGTARDFSPEACLALEPDLVLLPARLQDAADTLTDMGVPVILLNPESTDGVIQMIEIIGAATGTASRADLLIKWYTDMLSDIKSKAAQAGTAPEIYITGTGSWLSTSPGDMYQSSLLGIAGGNNVAGDIEFGTRVEVSYEQLLAMNPDVIIIASEADFGIDDILGDKQLASLTAVSSGKVYKMPSDYEAWDSPVPSSMLGAKWLLNITHDNIDLTNELEQDIKSFYNEFYNIK